MFGVYQFGVATFDAPSRFSGVTTVVAPSAFLSASGVAGVVFFGHATVAIRPTMASPGGVNHQLYSGQTTIARRPTFFSYTTDLVDTFGQATLSRGPVLAAGGVRTVPFFSGNVLMYTTHPTVGATSIGGLFGWWKFATGTGGYDATNLGHQATLSPAGSSAAGGHLILDGSRGYATVSDDPFDMGVSSFSVVVRAKPSLIDGYYRSILSKRSNSSYRGWALYRDGFSNRIVFEVSDSGNLPFWHIASTGAMAVNVENHVVVSVSREMNVASMYVDGVLQQYVNIALLGSFNNTILLTFGNEVGQDHWQGTLGDIRFYKRALGAGEAAALASGQDLYGDVPVFGTFTVPVYYGATVASNHPVIAAVGGRAVPPSGGATVATRVVMGSSASAAVPVYAGRSVILARAGVFAAVGARSIPVYAATLAVACSPAAVLRSAAGALPPRYSSALSLRASHALISSACTVTIPVYSGGAALTLDKIAIDSVGVNYFKAFIYNQTSYIVRKVNNILYMGDFVGNNIT